MFLVLNLIKRSRSSKTIVITLSRDFIASTVSWQKEIKILNSEALESVRNNTRLYAYDHAPPEKKMKSIQIDRNRIDAVAEKLMTCHFRLVME